MIIHILNISTHALLLWSAHQAFLNFVSIYAQTNSECFLEKVSFAHVGRRYALCVRRCRLWLVDPSCTGALWSLWFLYSLSSSAVSLSLSTLSPGFGTSSNSTLTETQENKKWSEFYYTACITPFKVLFSVSILGGSLYKKTENDNKSCMVRYACMMVINYPYNPGWQPWSNMTIMLWHGMIMVIHTRLGMIMAGSLHCGHVFPIREEYGVHEH